MSDPQPPEAPSEDPHAQAVAQWRERAARQAAAKASETGGPDEPGDESAEDSEQPAGSPAPRRPPKRKSTAKWPFWVELPVLVVVAFVLTFLIQTFIARVYYVPSGSMEQTLHGTANGGDRILAYKLVYDFRDPRQGEVVVFKGPDTWTPEADIPGPSSWLGKLGQAVGSVVGIAPANEKDFVKRVIAVGGQTVQCCDAKGRVEVDGVPLDEPYIYQPIDEAAWDRGTVSCKVDPSDPDRYDSTRCFAPFTVPEGDIWVMGDHRSESSDSSINCLGKTPEGVKQYQELHAEHQPCARPVPVKDVIGKAVFIVMPPSRWGTVGSPDIMSSAAAVTFGPSMLPTTAPAVLGIGGTLGLWWVARVVPRGRRRSRAGAPRGSPR